jgi:hypothetical protein
MGRASLAPVAGISLVCSKLDNSENQGPDAWPRSRTCSTRQGCCCPSKALSGNS